MFSSVYGLINVDIMDNELFFIIDQVYQELQCGVTRPQWVQCRRILEDLGEIWPHYIGTVLCSYLPGINTVRLCWHMLTHWGRVTHICVSNLTIIGAENGLSPGRRQAIICTNDGILLIRPLRTNFSEILSAIHTFSFKKMHLKTSSTKWRPFCLGLNVLNISGIQMI